MLECVSLIIFFRTLQTNAELATVFRTLRPFYEAAAPFPKHRQTAADTPNKSEK